jgi:hypothetical protein
MKISS